MSQLRITLVTTLLRTCLTDPGHAFGLLLYRYLLIDVFDVSLNFLDDPVFVLDYPKVIYYENDTETAVLSCRVKSHPPATLIVWESPTTDGRYSVAMNTIEVTSKYSVLEQTLTISPVTATDYGNFTCQATNGVKSINTTSTLIIHCE